MWIQVTKAWFTKKSWRILLLTETLGLDRKTGATPSILSAGYHLEFCCQPSFRPPRQVQGPSPCHSGWAFLKIWHILAHLRPRRQRFFKIFYLDCNARVSAFSSGRLFAAWKLPTTNDNKADKALGQKVNYERSQLTHKQTSSGIRWMHTCFCIGNCIVCSCKFHKKVV